MIQSNRWFHVIFEIVKKVIFTFTFLVTTGVTVSFGQNFLSWQYSDRYFSLSVGAGKAAYFGELNEPNRIQTNLANFPLGLEVRLWSQVAAKLEVAMYKINGADHLAPDSSFQKQRNLSFESWNFESTLSAVYYFKPYNKNYHKRWKTDPYVSLGVGFTTLNPKADLLGTTYKLRDPKYRTEDATYGAIAAIIPAAAGLKFRVNPFINFNIELAFRYTFTDYLDDVSTVYPDLQDDIPSQLSNRKDEIPIVNQEAYDQQVTGGRRGDPNNNDHYAFLNFKLEIFLPNNKGPLLQKPSAF